MTTQERNKKMTADQVAYHSSLIRTQVKKKRTCIQCSKTFVSASAGQRRCNVCKNSSEKFGEMAY